MRGDRRRHWLAAGVVVLMAGAGAVHAGDMLPIGVSVEAGVARSAGGISATETVLACVLDYRVTEYLGWRLRGGLVEFSEDAGTVRERFLQLNATYFPSGIQDRPLMPQQFYLTGGLGLHDTRSRGGVENRDKAKGGINAGAGWQVPLFKGWPLLRFEALYNSVKQVNPSNFISVTVGIKLLGL